MGGDRWLAELLYLSIADGLCLDSQQRLTVSGSALVSGASCCQESGAAITWSAGAP